MSRTAIDGPVPVSEHRRRAREDGSGLLDGEVTV